MEGGYKSQSFDATIKESKMNADTGTIIPKIVAVLPLAYTEILNVRGDGRCLIRAMVAFMERHLPNELANSLLNHGLQGLMGSEGLIEAIFQKLLSAWDVNDGPIEYHIDDNAIGGFGILLLMKLLNVRTLKVFQAFDNKGLKAGWTTFEQEAVENQYTVYLYTADGCHYRAFV